MKKINVFTASWGQLHGRHSNMGDIIIFEAVVDILKSLDPIEKIYCYSSDPSYTDKQYAVQSANPFNLKGLIEIIRNIHRSDLVLLGGGELVQTKSSFLYLVANLAPGLLSWIFQKRCLAVGIGVADEDEISGIGKIISRFILNRIDRICVREQASFRNALSLGILRRKLALSADLAFHFSGLKSSALCSAARTILLSPRYTKKRKGSVLPSWVKWKMGRKIDDADFDASAEWFAELLKQLCRAHNVIILPVYQSQRTSSADYLFSRKIIKIARFPDNAKIYKGPMSADSVMRLMGKIDVAVAVPLHSLVMAAVMGKPIFALEYASKCRNLMEELKLNYLVVPAEDQGKTLDTLSVFRNIEECIKNRFSLSLKIEQSIAELHHRCRENVYSIESVVAQLSLK